MSNLSVHLFHVYKYVFFSMIMEIGDKLNNRIQA